MNTDYNFTGKKYLVTGASSGIGQTVAICLSKLGGKVVLSGRDEERLNQTFSQMNGEGHAIMPYDLTELDGIKDYVHSCVAVDGQKFDGLVFSAGGGKNQLIRTMDTSAMLSAIYLNFCSYALMLKEFSSRRISNDKGSVVALSSRAAVFPGKAQGCYAASKAAVDVFSEVAAKELVNRRVRVNTIRPEFCDTPMGASFFTTVPVETQRKFYPLGKLSTEDVCNLILFLLSDLSDKITGQHIYISGGNFGSEIDFRV